jgi:molybdate transport system ATP-binding protein
MSALAVRIGHTQGTFSLDVDFAVPKTGVTALFGPSGAGKSTIIAAIAGLLRPRSGHIRVGDTVLFDAARGICVPPERRRMGCVFQQPLLFPHLRVRENCAFGARRSGAPQRAADIARVIELLGISALLDRYPRHLSGGEGQRVAIARALLSSPRMLLLDEPLSAVDEARRRDVLPYLERLRDEAGLPVVYVSHALCEVTRLADHAIVLEAGRVAARGPVAEVCATSRPGHADETGAVIQATVESHDDRDSLTRVRFAGGELLLPQVPAPVGASLPLFVPARDVLLSLHPLENVSANNVLPVTITALREVDNAQLDVGLRCGATALVARLTRPSVRRLHLAVGMDVYAVIKTVQLRG